MGTDRASPEETLVLREKATRAHHALLVSLKKHLELHGWTEIEEIPAAVDLWARRPRDHKRVIFEAKTLGGANGNHQSRIALAQLLEYRFFFGTPEDELCLVVDAILDDARVRFLESAQVAVLHVERGSVRGVGRLGGVLIESSANA